MNEGGRQEQHRQQDEGGRAKTSKASNRRLSWRMAMIWMRAIHIPVACLIGSLHEFISLLEKL
jgi:hypothetical protein